MKVKGLKPSVMDRREFLKRSKTKKKPGLSWTKIGKLFGIKKYG